jgi:acetylornithine deacetylase/succinyl-diaminopimelate desuccinylase-like protein
MEASSSAAAPAPAQAPPGKAYPELLPCSDSLSDAQLAALVQRFAHLLTFRTVSSSNTSVLRPEWSRMDAWLRSSYADVFSALDVEMVRCCVRVCERACVRAWAAAAASCPTASPVSTNINTAPRCPRACPHCCSVQLGAGSMTYLLSWRGSQPGLDPVLFLAHTDVVPAPPETLQARLGGVCVRK